MPLVLVLGMFITPIFVATNIRRYLSGYFFRRTKLLYMKPIIILWSSTTEPLTLKMRHFAPVKCCKNKSKGGNQKENLINNL